MRMLELCAGIGAMSYVWRDVLGQEVAGQVEIDPFCLRVLEAHFPGVPRLGDIREVKGTEFGSVDLVCAGFPCQPASVAGKRRGARDDRWLWPEVHRIIRSMQPAWCLLENVPGLISLGLDDVLADLGSAGYEAWPLVLPAAAVGAPHLRERIFIVAYAVGRGGRWQEGDATKRGAARQSDWRAGAYESGLAYATSSGRARRANAERVQSRAGRAVRAKSRGQDVEYASGPGCEERDPSRVASDAGHAAGRSDAPRRADALEYASRGGCDKGRPAVYAGEGHDAQGASAGRAQSGVGRVPDGLSAWLDGHRWPAGPGEAQAEWEAPRTVTGRVPDRCARLKALGNAIVPQQVAPILAAILHAHLTYGQEAA